MTPEDRGNAVVGTLSGLMPEVYQHVAAYVAEMVREAVIAERERCAKLVEECDEVTRQEEMKHPDLMTFVSGQIGRAHV